MAKKAGKPGREEGRSWWVALNGPNSNPQSTWRRLTRRPPEKLFSETKLRLEFWLFLFSFSDGKIEKETSLAVTFSGSSECWWRHWWAPSTARADYWSDSGIRSRARPPQSIPTQSSSLFADKSASYAQFRWTSHTPASGCDRLSFYCWRFRCHSCSRSHCGLPCSRWGCSTDESTLFVGSTAPRSDCHVAAIQRCCWRGR